MTARRKRRSPAKPENPERSKATFDLPTAMLTELRAVTVRVPLADVGGSLSGLVQIAIERELVRLRKRHNRDKPFRAPEGMATPRGRPPLREG